MDNRTVEDAPAVGETEKTVHQSRFGTVIVIVAGVLLVVAVGVATWWYMHAKTAARFAATVDYVATQSLSYDAFNNAFTTKSLVRVMENADEIARDLERGGAPAAQTLAGYADDLDLTAAIVLDAQGNPVVEHCGDGVGYEQLHDELCVEPVLEIACRPVKSYTVRVPLADGSVADIGCASRLDTEGVVVAVRHQSAKLISANTVKLQSLLKGYETAENGNIVIEGDGVVVASNVAEADATGAIEISDQDESAVSQIKRGQMGSLELVNVGGRFYLGSYGKARDYYVYTYMPAGHLLHSVGVNMFGTATVYISVCVAILMIRRRFERKHFTELLEQERTYGAQLEHTALAAQAANRAKTEFLQRMSHDIRTPINGIRGMVEVGDAYADDAAKQAECRTKIWTASGLLLDLVNEALDMSKLESGEVNLDPIPCDLGKLNSEVCEILERAAVDRGISIAYDQDSIEHAWVMASTLHLKRLLVNIAGNAVKYNRPGGHVRFICRELAYDAGVARFEYTVEDDGIGMDEKFQKHIYEPFSREERETEEKASGTGLGTSIAKQLVELMGGTIGFTSELGVGTTFIIRLPFETCEAGSATERRVAAEGDGHLRGLRVLLAEDNELNAEIALFTLERLGVEVIHVEDGEQAVAAFVASAPGEYDVVLMDIMMPGVDGYEATRRIRALDRDDARTVRIVAMSANAFVDDRQRSREVGMDAHLAKPLDSNELADALSEIMDKRGRS